MSQFTPETIKIQMAEYDTIVRKAVNDGDMTTVNELQDEIVSVILYFFYLLNNKNSTQKLFYKTCMRFTDSELLAAFNHPLFLHSFLKEYRKKKEDPTFIEDQQRRMRKYDEKRKDNQVQPPRHDQPEPRQQKPPRHSHPQPR